MQPTCVALLAEGVDRNHTYMPDMIDLMASPSSRRAWIEIPQFLPFTDSGPGRPPRGGRG
mgnify:CR=1 FL=1